MVVAALLAVIVHFMHTCAGAQVGRCRVTLVWGRVALCGSALPHLRREGAVGRYLAVAVR